jgi:heme oxygenase
MILHLLNVITAYKPNEFSKQIKKETRDHHDTIENHPFIREMLDGTLPDYKYAIYLANLLPIYKGVENFLLQQNYNKDIIQSEKILEDLSQYSTLLNYHFESPRANIIFYKDWLNNFYGKTDFYKKTELYIRWLADMYGGQIIKKNIRFTSKYEFKTLRKDIQQVRRMIENDLDGSNIDSFIDEVIVSYNFNYKLTDYAYSCSEKDLWI